MSQPDNILLSRLDDSYRSAIQRRLRIVSLEQRQTLHEPYEPVRSVYFPVSAVCSLVSGLRNGDSVQVATIGCEGMTGASISLATAGIPFRTIAHVSGEAYVMDGGEFRSLLAEDSYFRQFVQRYVLAFLVELGQTVVCGSLHRIEERLARWLLLSHDRAQRDEFAMTHDLMAEMLGVRRASVTETAGELHRRGAIDSGRGRVRIADRAALEAASCECYAVIREAYDRLLKDEDAA